METTPHSSKFKPFRQTSRGTKAFALLFMTAIVIYTVHSEKPAEAITRRTNNIINNNGNTTTTTRNNTSLNAEGKATNTEKKLNSHKKSPPSVLQQLQTSGTKLDHLALLQTSATDSSRPPLVRSLASLQLALDAYVDGIKFRVESEADGFKVRFSSKSKGRLSDEQGVLHVPESGWNPCVKDDSVLVSGTSFSREIYFALLRRLKHEKLDQGDKMIASYNATLSFEENCTRLGLAFKGTLLDGRRWCIYNAQGTNGCNLPGPAGLFLKRCGMPKSQVRHFGDVNITAR